MDDGIPYLVFFLGFLKVAGAVDTCSYEGLLGPSTMTCLYGCCGSTFTDACCDRTESSDLDSFQISQIVGGVVGGLTFLAFFAIAICCFCRIHRGSGFGRSTMGMRAPAGQPYTVYPQSNTVGAPAVPYAGGQTTHPTTTYGPAGNSVEMQQRMGPTQHPTTYGPVAGSMGTAYPPPEMQYGMGHSGSGFSTDPLSEKGPSAPIPSSDPPPYPGTGSFGSMGGGHSDTKSDFY